MHPPYIVMHKHRGETPLAAIERWRQSHPEYASLPASYAGRLDPMAEGKLLVLLGEERKKQKKYTKLDKEYVIEVVLDLQTDTGDTLGLPSYAGVETFPDAGAIRKALTTVSGTHRVPYPAFSSKPVNGKPLFMYALEGSLNTIQVPEHDETVYTTSLLHTASLTRAELQNRIEEGLITVPKSDEPSKAPGADFRQDVIRAGWRTLFSHIPDRTFTLLTLRVTCASGTYMRTLGIRLAKELNSTAITLSINRTHIGVYKKFGPFSFWIRRYT